MENQVKLPEINLDCYVDESELQKVLSEINEAKNNLGLLARYCQHKISAMGSRKRGNIDFALMHERECEKIYGQLPEDVRW